MTKKKTDNSPEEVASPVAETAERKDVDTAAIEAEATKKERKRSQGIRQTAKSLGTDDKFTRKHIDAGTSEDEFRKLAVDEYGERDTNAVAVGESPIVMVEDARDKFARGASDWLITRASLGAKVKASEGVDKLAPGEFRGFTLLDLARVSLKHSGVETRGLSKVDVAGKALSHRSGMQTTSDFPVLLENTLNRILLASYATVVDTWSRFCAKGSVSDFRPHKRLRMGTFDALDVVNEAGEFTNKAIPDARAESLEAKTRGNIIALTRQAIINDDIGAFSTIANRIGQSARLTIEKDVYALLALNGGLGPVMGDGKTLFHADHKNIGSAAALSVDALDADAVVMANQMDDSNNEILDIEPDILVVSRGQRGNALVLNKSEYDVDTSSKKSQVPNKVQGIFRDIVGTQRVSGTRRYMFADPQMVPTIEVAFLDGQETPYLEMKEGWRVDGAEWKCRLDYAVGAIDYKGAVTNSGS